MAHRTDSGMAFAAPARLWSKFAAAQLPQPTRLWPIPGAIAVPHAGAVMENPGSEGHDDS
jgi:hypothetical protein